MAAGTRGKIPWSLAYEVKTVKRGGIHLKTGHVTASPNNKLRHLPAARTLFRVREFADGCRLQEFEVEEELGDDNRGATPTLQIYPCPDFSKVLRAETAGLEQPSGE
jgi:hypothetical protein